MGPSFESTREANLSEVEAKLDAIAHPAGDRTTSVSQPIQKLIVEGHCLSPVVVTPLDKITFGRSNECGLAIPTDHRISRVHCAVECSPLEALLRDLQSTNGTYLNGQRIRLAKLIDGDRILIGATVLIVRIVRTLRK